MQAELARRDIYIGKKLIPADQNFYIVGPDAAYDENQMLESARAAKAMGAAAVRGPDYKPRTTPGTFEGVGKIAYPWYVRILKEVDIPIAFEIADSEHLREVAQYIFEHAPDANILGWIGARTTGPRVVDKIAKEAGLKEYDGRISLGHKNPLYGSAAEWKGLAGRLIQPGGVRHDQVVLVYRGNGKTEDTPHTINRSKIDHSYAMKVAEELQLPILFDPSHSAGKRYLIGKVVQEVSELPYRGLMIEADSPEWIERALCDKEQMVTREEAAELIQMHRSHRRVHHASHAVSELQRYAIA